MKRAFFGSLRYHSNQRALHRPPCCRLFRNLRQAVDKFEELQIPEEPHHFIAVHIGNPAGFQVERYWRPYVNGCKDLAFASHHFIGSQKLLNTRRSDLADMIVNLFYPAELEDKLSRRFFTDAFHPGYIVRGVAFQSF